MLFTLLLSSLVSSAAPLVVKDGDNIGFLGDSLTQFANREYGFILRYPLGKEEVTGIQFEPWHFRYVGVDAAEVITSQNITLEEFVENL